jgi:hypothetical protein
MRRIKKRRVGTRPGTRNETFEDGSVGDKNKRSSTLGTHETFRGATFEDGSVGEENPRTSTQKLLIKKRKQRRAR